MSISIDDVAKLELRVGTILEANPHPNADRLMVLQVKLSETETRQIVAGIRGKIPEADLLQKQALFVTNLEPVKLRGVDSFGMIFAASDDQGGFALLTPTSPVLPGTVVK